MLVVGVLTVEIRAREQQTDPQAPTRPQPARLPEIDVTARRWRRRPVLRAAIRLAVALAPAAATAGVAIGFSRAILIPSDLAGTIAWWAAFAAVIVATWLLTSEILQQALPLATLLDLSLVFPDTAPSRFSILTRRLDHRRLETDMRRLREMSDPESEARARLVLELAVALSIHDSRTRGHSERVRTYTDLVAKELHLRQRDADRLRWAALLHDVGKLAVAPEILNKTALPDDEERVSLHNHPIEGYRLIEPLHAWLGPWAATVRDHHERFDGTGYPNGLRGRAISLGGRIVAVTDSYETMTAGRPYRTALSVSAAREELVRRSGTHFDPEIVRAFLAVSLGRLWPIAGIGSLFAGVPLLGRLPWRLTDVGSRTASGFAAAGVTVTVLIASHAITAVSPSVYGMPSNNPPVATISTLPSSVQSPGQATPNSPAATSPATPSSVRGSSASSSPSGGAGPSAASGSPGGGGKALYPAGIAKHQVLPAGIAKQVAPFAQWRLKH